MRSNLTMAGILALSIVASSPSNSQAQTAPFTGMAGSWSGSGTISMSDGSRERIRCRANYSVGSGGAALQQQLRCASDSYRFDLSSDLVSEGNSASAQGRADVRRIETSTSFRQQFGQPAEQVITLDHSLGRVLPVGRRMTRSTTISITDRNGQAHECVAEAFDTTFNVLILVYPLKALSATRFTLN